MNASLPGFFRAIEHANYTTIKDTLRVLTLWFKWGHLHEVATLVEKEFASVSIDTWLDVLPQVHFLTVFTFPANMILQLMARVSSPHSSIRLLVHRLINNVARVHPQALIFPLTVVAKSQSSARASAGEELLERLKAGRPTLVHQALLIGRELIRASCIWHEMWIEALETASRAWQGDRDSEAMLAALEPVYAILEGVNTIFGYLFETDVKRRGPRPIWSSDSSTTADSS